MRYRTLQNVVNITAGLTVKEALGPNPRRKAIILSPVVYNGFTNAPIGATTFAKGTSQFFTTPTSVSNIIDVFLWGSGGNPGAAGATLGGGGGGGGSFATVGPVTTTPGQKWKLDVDSAGTGSATNWYDQAGAVQAGANSGVSGVLDGAGLGGTVGVGIVTTAGGKGAAATALAGVGGGGGGAGGYATSGSDAVASAGGAGGGAAFYGAYGLGGTGGAGSASGVVGLVGGTPGAGGGGSGRNGAVAAGGADGLAVVFYEAPISQTGVSLSRNENVSVGQGSLNYLFGHPYTTIITDDEMGTAICDPWFIVSGIDSTVVQITEIMYEHGECEPAF